MFLYTLCLNGIDYWLLNGSKYLNHRGTIQTGWMLPPLPKSRDELINCFSIIIYNYLFLCRNVNIEGGAEKLEVSKILLTSDWNINNWGDHILVRAVLEAYCYENGHYKQ